MARAATLRRTEAKTRRATKPALSLLGRTESAPSELFSGGALAFASQKPGALVRFPLSAESSSCAASGVLAQVLEV